MFARRNRYLFALLFLFGSFFTGTIASAQYPNFYVCMENDTGNPVHYSVDWCARAGFYCTGYRNWTVPPYSSRMHWGPAGDGRMDVRIQTGGPGGIYLDYSLYGSANGCSTDSIYDIVYNDRGFLRIVHKY